MRFLRILSLLFALLAAVPAFAQVGVVTRVEGDVQLERNGEFYTVEEGVELFPDDIIRSSGEASAQFDMDDGSLLSIGADAEIKIADYALAEDKSVVSATVDVLSGWLRFAVAKLRSDRQSYRFSMPTAVIGVRGTEGVIEVSGSGESASSQVLLEEGEVEVAEQLRKNRLYGQKVRLKAGQFAERKFGRLLMKRSRVPEAFTKRVPGLLKVKLKQRVHILKKRGVRPQKVRQILRKKQSREQMKERRNERQEQREQRYEQKREKLGEKRERSYEKKREQFREQREQRYEKKREKVERKTERRRDSGKPLLKKQNKPNRQGKTGMKSLRRPNR